MPNPRRKWDTNLDKGLPDSRLSFNRHRSIFRFGRVEYEKVFCANCGADGGGVTAEYFAHCLYICEACADRLGKLDLHEIPASAVREQVS